MDDASNDISLREYLRILVRRKWIIVVTVVAALASAVLVTALAPRVYEASSDLLITDPSQGSVFNIDISGLLAGRDLQTQIEIMKARPLRTAVEKKLGSRARFLGSVNVTAVGTTNVARVRTQSSLPSVARDAADAYASVFIEQRTRQSVDSILVASNELQRKSNEKKAQLEDLDAQIARLLAAPKPDTGAVDSLRAQRNDAESQYSTYRDKYDQLSVDAVVRSGGAQLVAKAELPQVPVRPTPIRNAVLALVLGLFVGVGLAFLFEYLDDTVKSADDLERHAAGVAFLGAIPNVSDWRNRDRARSVTLDSPHSPVAEAYRALRTSVQFVALRQPLQTLLLTSPMSSEGKSTTIANLGVTLARSGKDVVLVDCDLRKPRLHEFFGLDHAIGFTSVLLGDEPLSSALRTVDIGPGGSLRVLPSGPLPPNPSELLGTNRVAELLTALQGTAEIVLVDSPPLLPVTDALVLSRRVDGVLLVATAGLTSRRHLSRSVALLEHAEAPIIGIALNAVSAEGGYGSDYGYSYYRQEPVSRRRRRESRAAERNRTS